MTDKQFVKMRRFSPFFEPEKPLIVKFFGFGDFQSAKVAFQKKEIYWKNERYSLFVNGDFRRDTEDIDEIIKAWDEVVDSEFIELSVN